MGWPRPRLVLIHGVQGLVMESDKTFLTIRASNSQMHIWSQEHRVTIEWPWGFLPEIAFEETPFSLVQVGSPRPASVHRTQTRGGRKQKGAISSCFIQTLRTSICHRQNEAPFICNYPSLVCIVNQIDELCRWAKKIYSVWFLSREPLWHGIVNQVCVCVCGWVGERYRGNKLISLFFFFCKKAELCHISFNTF